MGLSDAIPVGHQSLVLQECLCVVCMGLPVLVGYGCFGHINGWVDHQANRLCGLAFSFLTC